MSERPTVTPGTPGTPDTPGTPGSTSGDRSVWRKVAVPSEHGGWGLTLEPALLGLLVAPSWAGAAIGLAALLAFLARTPSKIVLVDLGRRRWLPRTTSAAIVAAAELVLVVALGAGAVVASGWSWIVPIILGLPLLLVELWYDARSRGRRLVPELAGAIGIAATAAAIVVADDRSLRLGFALWAILAARALVSIPYIRSQILRLRRGTPMRRSSVVLQLAGVALAIVAGVVVPAVLVGTVGVAAIGAAQVAATRRPVPPPKVLGVRQLLFGVALAVATAIGVHVIG